MSKAFSFEEYDDVFSYKDPQGETTRVFSFKKTPETDLTTYSCQEFTLHPEIFQKDLLLISRNKSEIDIPSIVNAAAKFFLRHPDNFHHGRYTPSLGLIDKKSNMSAFYVSHPIVFDDPDINRKYLFAIAISKNELNYLKKFGPKKFEDHLRNNNIDIFNLLRKDSLKQNIFSKIMRKL